MFVRKLEPQSLVYYFFDFHTMLNNNAETERKLFANINAKCVLAVGLSPQFCSPRRIAKINLFDEPTSFFALIRNLFMWFISMRLLVANTKIGFKKKKH